MDSGIDREMERDILMDRGIDRQMEKDKQIYGERNTWTNGQRSDLFMSLYLSS